MDDPVGRWFLQILLLLLSAFLAVLEAALSHANENRISETAGNGRSRKMLDMLSRPKPALTSLRGLRTLFLMLAAALAAVMFGGSVLSALVSCLILAFVAMILCKLAPEKLGKLRADSWYPRLYPLIAGVHMIMFPFTWAERKIGQGILMLFGVAPQMKEEEVTQEDILSLVDKSEEAGAIESEESEMIKNVFDFSDLTAADCMTHRTAVTAIWVEDDADTILRTIQESGLSRFPVYKERIDDVIGVLATRDFLLNLESDHPRPLRALLREPYFVPETVPSDVLLRNMQRAKTHLAVVVDEYGGMSGIITMEDLLEEIVGNIYDEFDPTAENEIQPLGENEWKVSGAAELENLAEEMGVTLPEGEDFDTLGGLIFSRFSTIPEDGSTPEITFWCTEDGEEPDEDQDPVPQVHVQALSIADRRVEWAKVTLIPVQEEKEKE